MKPVRKAASLIVLAKNSLKNTKSNFEILLQKRQKNASSFADSVVFPGGVVEKTDDGDAWLEYFKSFKIQHNHFLPFHHENAKLTPLFKENPMMQHVTLRISAIRETFEEAGLLVCKKEFNPQINSKVADLPMEFDVEHWQKKVHNDSSQFLELCKHLQCFPDVWSLHYWNNWLTPNFMQNRFDTAFFIVGFNEKPIISTEETEVAHFDWMRPEEVLDAANKGILEVYPPQVYEMYRFINFRDFDKVIDFASDKSKYGCPRFYPVWADVIDGRISLLPGDSLYPKEVDEFAAVSNEYKNYSMKDLRSKCESLNRFEKHYDEMRLVMKNLKIPNHIDIEYIDEKVCVRV